MKKISFVIPVFNEEASLPELIEQIKRVLETKIKNYDYEIIFINDGSNDHSLEVMKKLKEKKAKIKIISFRKNLGKATALNEGFRKARGDLVLTMDADLQDDPINIPNLIEQLNKGYDLVVGWKKKRFDPMSKVIPSAFFNLLVRGISQISLHDFNSGLKIMKKEVAKELYLYGELHRLIPVLAFYKGFKVSEVEVSHHTRKYGSSKYGAERLIRGFLDFITVSFLGRYGQKPLHFFGLIGVVSIFIGSIFGAYLSVLHFMGEKIGNRPLLILSVLLVLAGLQLLSIGLMAEMMIRKNTKVDGALPIDYES